MPENAAPTKGNLMQTEKTLALSKQGYSMLDRKRVILINEIMSLVKEAEEVQKQIDQMYQDAYAALEQANVEAGIRYVEEIASTVPVENSLKLKVRSVMGTEIPLVEYDETPSRPTYSFYSTNSSLDEARVAFEKVKKLTIHLSMIENTAFRLANNIRKTQKRANALKNISIPKLETARVGIVNALEEKEREEFTRLKVVKEKIIK